MANLQHEFTYEGNNFSEVPFTQISWNLEIPTFEYVNDQRNLLGSHSLKFFQALKSESYAVNFLNEFLIGQSDDSILNFWRFSKNFQKNLGSLSFRANRSVMHDTQVLRQDSVEIIYSLATSSIEYDQIIAAEIALNQGVFLNPVEARKVASAIIKYAKENLLLINKAIFDKVVVRFKELAHTTQEFPLLRIISHLADISTKKPILVNINATVLADLITREGLGLEGNIQDIIKLISDNFDTLFNFPISVPEIKILEIKGDIKFLSQRGEMATKTDLFNYDLSLEYTEQVTNQPRTVKYRWESFSDTPIPDNLEEFDFRKNNEFVLIANPTTSVTVTLRLLDNTILEQKTFDGLDKEDLAHIHFEVDLFKLPQPNNTDTKKTDDNKQLKGKVLEISGKCPLQDLTVIIQAKEKATDPLWKVVASATTSNAGDFVMKYPFGEFEKAQAIVSLTPDSPVDIFIFTDEDHKKAKETISTDFLFLLLKDAKCEPKVETATGDCGCDTKERISRLPNHEDLINSDKFSQDLGGGACVNLTTPNRTLNETVNYAIVRTSEPDVANYVLEKSVVSDSNNPTDFSKNKTTFKLSNGQKIDRQPVDFGNPIRWQDDPDDNNNLTIYQAVQVAHGHLLTYKTVWKADGYSLGDVLYSLPLLPGQKKLIVINELKRTLEGSQQQQLSQREGLNASITNDRTILDNLSGSIRESLQGRSTARTGGVSAGLGIAGIGSAISGVLGISGGFSKSGSTASQDSARAVQQSFSESLRNVITQSANSFRELNGTIIETVSESQQFATTSEVVANHNHCHTLTILYFEVLRHYAIYQELAQVEECIFVPLLMTVFTTENIYQWRDVLAENLLDRPSSTYLTTLLGKNPLLKAFDANERIKTNYANVDYPAGAFDEETIREVIGELYVRVNFERPKTRYDRIKSFPIVKQEDTHNFWAAVGGLLAGPLGIVAGGIFGSDGSIKVDAQSIIDEYIEVNANYANIPPAQSIRVKKFDELFFDGDATSLRAWTSYAILLGKPDALTLLKEFFEKHLVSEWDAIFYDEIAPALIKKLADNITLDPFNADFTALGKYGGGEQVIRFNFRGTTNLPRKLIADITLQINSSQTIASDLTTIIAENLSVRYVTNHYNGTIFSGYLGDDLSSTDPVIRTTPESSDEKRNPRKEDIFIVNELITHLNSNLEYYNKILWLTLDPDRRYLLLDGFNIEAFDNLLGGIVNKSLASVVKNQLIGIAGNSIIFPVAEGVIVNKQDIIITPPALESRDRTPTQSAPDLFEQYKPLTPAPPYRISVPTRGVYAEAVQGACDACEKVEADTSQDWEKFKTDEPTAINPVSVGVPTPTAFNPQFKDFAPPIVNIQNAPAAPAPGVGLEGLSALLGKSDIFKDVTGLSENQKNALQTFLSNQENAKAFGEMAKDLLAISQAKKDGTMTNEQAKKAVDNVIPKSDEEKLGLLDKVLEFLKKKTDSGQLPKETADEQATAATENTVEETTRKSKPNPFTSSQNKSIRKGKKKFNLNLLIKSFEARPLVGTFVLTYGSLIDETFTIETSSVKSFQVELDTSRENILQIRGNPFLVNASFNDDPNFYYHFTEVPTVIGSDLNLTFEIFQTRESQTIEVAEGTSDSKVIQDATEKALSITSNPSLEVDLLVAKFGASVSITGTRTNSHSVTTNTGTTETRTEVKTYLIPARRLKIKQKGIAVDEVNLDR